MSPIRWLAFWFVIVTVPAMFIAILAWAEWIRLPLTYETIASILAGYAGWAAFLHYAKFRELLQDFDRPRAGAGEKSFRFSSRYRQHLIHRHRFFDVKGLSTQGIYTLELERVFVELSIAPRSVHQAITDPIQTIPEDARRDQTIWSYLNLEPLAHQDLVVIGPPGCGKTTLLKHMVLTLIAGRKHRRRWRAPGKLPILLFLRDQAQAIQDDPNLSLPQAVCNDLARWHLRVPASWFESHLERGRCLVLLDGLDEVADPEARRQVVAWVQRQMEAYGGNRFVVTSRPHGYRQHRLSGVTVLQVSPFTREQVERFVHNWYVANEIMSAQKDDLGVRQDAEKGAADLLQRLRNTPDLADLAVNPLLLTMIATVHRYRSSLPGRRVELYKEICDVFLGQRHQARGLLLDLTPAQKQQVLQPLAYHLMCQRRREAPLEEAVSVITDPLNRVSPAITGEDFLKKVENESGLLLERESGVYAFAHKTFQEYMASAHALNQDLAAELSERVGEDWWNETIRLYTAQTDASPIVAACLAGDPPGISALILAIECGEEALELEPALRTRLEEVLTRGVEDPDPERRRPVAEALLALRLRRMIRIDEDHYLDGTLITHAEYQLFLDDSRAQGEYYQPDHWTGEQFPAGQGRKPVVGVRPSDGVAFGSWLTEREAGEWCYRLPFAGEFQADSVEHVEGMAYWVQTAQAFECVPSVDRDLDLDLVLDSTRVSMFARDLDGALAFTRARALDLASDLASDVTSYRARDSAHHLASARAVTSDLDSARDRALHLASNLASYVASYRARDSAHHLASDLDRYLHLASDVASNLDHTLTRASDRARDLDHTLAFTRARALDLASARDSNLARDLDHTLARASELASDLAHALARASDRARDLDHTLARASASASDRAFALDLALERTSDLDRYLAFTRAHHPTAPLDPASNLARDLARDFGRALADRSQGGGLLLLHSSTRSRIAGLLGYLLPQIRPRAARILAGYAARERDAVFQHLVDTCVDLYVDLCILEARVAGELPAFEGIRLVRERQPVAQDGVPAPRATSAISPRRGK